MKENFTNESKNKWTRIFKKKWFFPALYIMIAAFLLTAVVWYQNIESKLIEGLDDNEQSDSYSQNPFDEEAESVLQQQEIIKMPVHDEVQTEIVTKFYDYNAEQEDQEKGLTLYNNRYYQSTGIDIASSDGDAFDVVASLSGTVTEVKEDPLLGNVVVMSHGENISTYYASLGEVEVETGAKIKQGDKIGTAGKNLFSEESGTHVHFEIRKADVEVNPEDFFNEPLSKIEELDVDAKVEEPSSDEQETDRPDSTEKEEEKPDSEDVDKEEEDSEDVEDEDAEESQNLSFSIIA
ncbi:peptidoglycan DD-metalloendopeptidase family protein [Pseudogracilibacillus auburnensis]|uniref:Stage II sporulation protein Q n=1 Tax=Pseudogracilibacillus auburnensis TaxID=1494959 RepID=A0A2V3VNF0_9BACI|nr:M23 family metallopeptidase [Pseudogracilibacillus auburnensis]MBO1004270.1 M23 family metallopeptidase [Pseudogracilibacillus auburnensis]PXW82391.1 stage II sporulation protein Q [Pseudogracilibacillus auburnensis]